MNLTKSLITIAFSCVLTAVNAQDNGLNPIYKVQLGDITYQKGEPSKKVTVGKVLGVAMKSISRWLPTASRKDSRTSVACRP